MKLESVGILIGMRPIGERDAVAHIFTRDYGVMCGVMRAAQIMKKNRPLIGQIGAVSWNARLDSQLGAFHWDAEKNMAAALMLSRDALNVMNAAFALIDALLPERERYDVLYAETIEFLNNAARPAPRECYLGWEIAFLRELGYALDLSRCSGCGRTVGLDFLSPRTGRAVCCECGAPYINKLYRLPLNLNTMMCFIDQVCNAQGVAVPAARRMLAIL